MSAVPQRRALAFSSFAEVLADAEHCVQHGASTTGQWTLGQILEHLAIVVDKSIDGFIAPAPWVVRIVATHFIKRRVLRSGMPPGFTLPPRGLAELVPATPPDPQVALAHLKRAIERLSQEPQRAPHPAFGLMTVDEWNRMHQRHAELHLSFVAECAPSGFRV